MTEITVVSITAVSRLVMGYDFGNVFQFLLEWVAIAGKKYEKKRHYLSIVLILKSLNFGMQ